jgi:aspartyl-tRNA(Asn)/glutamyl-tRNA(Gln) amidotransferase subunit B
MRWECVIGLEIHVQLKTKSKIFSGSSTAYGAMPNTQASYVDAALPGVLPVMNREAAIMAVKFGLAVGAEINQTSIFARKNYFYPDLPKGYQISQFEVPIVGAGSIDISVGEKTKTIGITRAHLEEDAGKSLHEDFQGQTGIDLNRAGTPLLEIVSDPDMRSPAEAVAYLRKIHTLVRYLEICDGNMQEGSFRCDANISMRRPGDELGTRAELKNINSFRFVEKAIEFEIERQIEVLEDGGKVVQETRLYDSDKHETRSMRGKEQAHDYRYFPDPDLPPLVIDSDTLADIKKSLPELPEEKTARFICDYQLSHQEASLLTVDKTTAEFFEAVLEKDSSLTAKLVANWIGGELTARLNKESLTITESAVSAESLALLLSRVNDNTISGKIAKDVFNSMWETGDAPDNIIEAKGLKQISDSGAIESIVDEVLARSVTQVDQYKAGQHKVLGFLVGQIMKESRGKANPAQVNQILKQKLES